MLGDLRTTMELVAPSMESVRAHQPYKGIDNYKSHDASMFFGRDAESEQVVARILASRATLLHAQSGAGKTSLLNARVIPMLESRGHTPVRILPQDDPAAS